MNEITRRKIILSEARRKYIPFHTKNISKALELYLKNSAEKSEQIPLTITKETKPKNIADLIGRLDCPKCKQKTMLRIIKIPQGKQNLKGWKTCWECINCGYEQYSTKTIQELIKESKNK